MSRWANFSADDFVVYGAALATFLLASVALLRAASTPSSGFWKKWSSVLFFVLAAAAVQVLSFEASQGEPRVALSSYLLLETIYRGRLLETYALFLALIAAGAIKLILPTPIQDSQDRQAL